MTELGLRIDVDTFRGTRTGVPAIQKILHGNDIAASFFFSVGPDNMGRHIWRLLKPAFFIKMVRSNAPGLYGWDILLRGTLWPGPVIGRENRDVIRSVANEGHETGLHAWDHHRWQARSLKMNDVQIYLELLNGYELLGEITGRPPSCSAAPGWICNDTVLMQKEQFRFTYNSDCRGSDIFMPVVDGTALNCPQVPTTLPTYDEIIGRNGIARENYNDHLISLIKPGRLNVLTIHAEVEGIVCRDLLTDFCLKCRQQGISIVPLGQLLKDREQLPKASISQGSIAGREGQVAVQNEIRSA